MHTPLDKYSAQAWKEIRHNYCAESHCRVIHSPITAIALLVYFALYFRPSLEQ
jgi:hypothetical protein